ncbi:hypothetical protein BX616_006299, partial [Lobosporangium transversale]|uniref:Rho-GAP domain-containing protein n=1 Tax=Lobosporangium transversale TaxID=64571 RepID=A0A1Y2G5S4_9FUNG|eukprot:XP_021875493.1 hypothetical protein BCR41DRAFT_232297 [Lobosporangium transversale]
MTDNSHNDPSTFSSTPPTMTDTTSLHELAATSPSSSAIKALPRPISIRHSQSYEPAPPSPTSDITLSELRGVRSSASLNLLASFSSTFTPQQHQPQQRPNHRSQIFSNPFKKLQNTFNSKRNSDLTSLNNNNYNNLLNGNRLERPVSSASSANSLTSWRTKGAEMLSKSWGRNRKYSEPLLKNVGAVVSASPIFGVDLKEAIRLSHIPNTPLVPAVLHRCAEFLEAKGVDEVGLYR